MTDLELINFTGTTLVNNWKYIFAGFFTFISACVAATWWFSNILHKKEIRVLKLELTHQKERFNQFESIVEQRVLALQHEAELLQRKTTPSSTDSVADLSQKEMNLGDDEYLDIPVFLRKAADSTEVAEPANNYSSPSKIKEFLEKTDIINSVIKTAVGLV
tara:strand:+ start:807 stop:1289 length:483 start_codon:yes stop_codon:yes gene_type:complete